MVDFVALVVVSTVDLCKALPVAGIPHIAIVFAVRFLLRFTLLTRQPIHRFVVFPRILSICLRGTVKAAFVTVGIPGAVRSGIGPSRPTLVVAIIIMGRCG